MQPIFDKQEQLDKIMSGLLAGESIIAVYDAIGAGTGFIGLTSRRVVIQDNSFVGKKIALTSIPYSKVQSVSFISDRSMFGKWASTSEIAIQPGETLGGLLVPKPPLERPAAHADATVRLSGRRRFGRQFVHRDQRCKVDRFIE